MLNLVKRLIPRLMSYHLNQGQLQFKDISGSSGIAAYEGWSTGVTMVDVNTDGWLDIYLINDRKVTANILIALLPLPFTAASMTCGSP